MNLSCPLNRSNKMPPPTEKHVRHSVCADRAGCGHGHRAHCGGGLGTWSRAGFVKPGAVAAGDCRGGGVPALAGGGFFRAQKSSARAGDHFGFRRGVCAGAGRAGERDSAGGRGDGAARGESSRILRAAANAHQRIHRATAGIAPSFLARAAGTARTQPPAAIRKTPRWPRRPTG